MKWLSNTLALVVLLAIFWWLTGRPAADREKDAEQDPPNVVVGNSEIAPLPIADESAIGAAILEGYASDTQGLREDLDQLGELLSSYLTLNKSPDPLPLASNLFNSSVMIQFAAKKLRATKNPKEFT